MSSRSTNNGVVYHLINHLTDVANQQRDSMDNKEESDQLFSPVSSPDQEQSVILIPPMLRKYVRLIELVFEAPV